MATVLCMKWGRRYGPDYVNTLYNMVRRNLTRAHRFLCLTDEPQGIRPEVECRPLPELRLIPEWERSPWRKLSCFAPELEDLAGPVLFLDLDLVIIANIDGLFDHPGEFCIIENWTQPGRGIGNSSVFRYRAGAHGDVFARFRADPGFGRGSLSELADVPVALGAGADLLAAGTGAGASSTTACRAGCSGACDRPRSPRAPRSSCSTASPSRPMRRAGSGRNQAGVCGRQPGSRTTGAERDVAAIAKIFRRRYGRPPLMIPNGLASSSELCDIRDHGRVVASWHQPRGIVWRLSDLTLPMLDRWVR